MARPRRGGAGSAAEGCGAARNRYTVRKTASFLELPLCLSRACLGKMIVFIYKWLKNAVFRRPQDVEWWCVLDKFSFLLVCSKLSLNRFHLRFKTIKLPRQAREKHAKETGTKTRRGGEFSCFSAGMLWTILASARRARRWQGLNTPPLPPGSSQVHATKRNAFQLRWVLKRHVTRPFAKTGSGQTLCTSETDRKESVFVQMVSRCRGRLCRSVR